jgi:hypothetical protein
MKRHWIKIAFAIPTVAVAAYFYSKTGVSRQEVVEKVFGSQQFLDSFVAAQQVTAQRLHLRQTNGLSPGLLSSYDRGQTVSVSQSQAREIQHLFQQPSSFLWNIGKGCIVDYGVLFTFRSGDRTIQLALCFNCNWFGIFDGPDGNARKVNQQDNFDPIRKDLVAIIKELFPEDAEIQELERHR